VIEDLDLRVALPAVAAWLVAWQGRLLPPGVLALGACCVALFAALVLLRSRGPRAAVVAAVCVCAAAAGLATAARVHARRTGPLAEAARSSASVTVEGVLTDDPRAVPPKADVLTFRQLVVAHVRVERLLVAGQDVHGFCAAPAPAPSPDARTGNCSTATAGRTERAHKAQNWWRR